jgi:hypothetical protein
MPNRVQPPSNLCNKPEIIVRVTRGSFDSKRVRLFTDVIGVGDKLESFDLGRYRDCNENRVKKVVRADETGEPVITFDPVVGAAVYLARALGGNPELAEDILSCAYSFEWAYVNIPRGRVTPLDHLDDATKQRLEVIKTFGDEAFQDLIDSGHLASSGMYVEPPNKKPAGVS